MKHLVLTIESMKQIKKAVDSGTHTIEQVLEQIYAKAEGRPLIKMLEEFYREVENAQNNSN